MTWHIALELLVAVSLIVAVLYLIQIATTLNNVDSRLHYIHAGLTELLRVTEKVETALKEIENGVADIQMRS